MSTRTVRQRVEVPFFRPSITEAEIEAVAACLRSGWLTTGPRTNEFETAFAERVGAKHAVAVNSCTAALHLAVEALKLAPGQAVLVPTMTFAATAEVVHHQGAVPILVDCDRVTLNMDLDDAEKKLRELKMGRLPLDRELDVVGIIPVHAGGLMMDVAALQSFAARHGLWIVEDAAHAFPAAFREGPDLPWQHCGENTAAVTCFSFYANKTITTGEGGMALTDDRRLAERMRTMSLHGLSHDAWNRYSSNGAWDYRLINPGFKYNLSDIAAAIGNCQLQRAEAMRAKREAIARFYRQALGDMTQFELPVSLPNRIHAWHLFPVRLRLEELSVDRNTFMKLLCEHRVGCSVHWRPLHLHPYYVETYGWQPEHCPIAASEWEKLISLPLFPGMEEEDQEYVVRVTRDLCTRHRAGMLPADSSRPKPR